MTIDDEHALALDDLPRDLIASGPQRRAAIACDLFALGWPFEAIDAALALAAAIDQALAEHIRNTLPTLRGLTPEAATRHLIDDVEAVRVALISDA
jgi:hypothetical protein